MAHCLPTGLQVSRAHRIAAHPPCRRPPCTQRWRQSAHRRRPRCAGSARPMGGAGCSGSGQHVRQLALRKWCSTLPATSCAICTAAASPLQAWPPTLRSAPGVLKSARVEGCGVGARGRMMEEAWHTCNPPRQDTASAGVGCINSSQPQAAPMLSAWASNLPFPSSPAPPWPPPACHT